MGYSVNFTFAALLGVLLVYIVRSTGNDYEIYKGLLIPNFLGFLLHIIFGLVSGWVVKQYGRV
ncbi:hypothetical protein JCM15060_03130 [Halanaerobaculum tunisiense]